MDKKEKIFFNLIDKISKMLFGSKTEYLIMISDEKERTTLNIKSYTNPEKRSKIIKMVRNSLYGEAEKYEISENIKSIAYSGDKRIIISKLFSRRNLFI